MWFKSSVSFWPLYVIAFFILSQMICRFLRNLRETNEYLWAFYINQFLFHIWQNILFSAYSLGHDCHVFFLIRGIILISLLLSNIFLYPSLWLLLWILFWLILILYTYFHLISICMIHLYPYFYFLQCSSMLYFKKECHF